MRLAVLLLAVFAAAPSAQAAPFVLDLPPGTHDIRFTVAADGTVRAVPLPSVTVGGVPLPPPVDPPPPPTPISTVVESLTNAALQGGATKTSGAAIASIYSLASVEVAKENGMDPLKAFDFTASATETVLGFQGDKAKWATFRAELSRVVLTPLKNAGNLTTREQVSSVMRQIAAGMDKATGFDSSPKSIAAVMKATPAQRATMGILDGIDIERILELIRLIMTLITLFKGG